MSYISPIKIEKISQMEEGWADKIGKYIAGEVDNLVLQSCVKVGCHVDKDELEKALRYDRGQYEKGYEDGKRDAAPRWVRCEEPPKEHMWCFVYTDEPDMIMPIRIAFYTASCTGKGSWYHYESGSDITDEVDYWTEMHLEGPKLDHDLPWPIEPPKEDA